MTNMYQLAKRLLPLCLCLLLPSLAWTQASPQDLPKAKNRRPSYIKLTTGLQQGSFRDWATSPLPYSGPLRYFALSQQDLDFRRESSLTLSYSAGKLRSDFNQHLDQSEVNLFALNYQELFLLPFLHSDRFQLKVGATLEANVNVRDNEALFNNSQGVEGMASITGTFKATLDLSRKVSKTLQFLFIRQSLQPRRKLLAWYFKLGLLNATYRNGFLYTGHAPIINSDDFFADYELQFFSGFRLSSHVDYTIYLSNENAFQFSYQWQAYRTGNLQAFEMAQHTLSFSFLFRL